MRRDFLIRSQRRPDVILAALEARSRQWRENEPRRSEESKNLKVFTVDTFASSLLRG
jgi:hypothetical protein